MDSFYEQPRKLPTPRPSEQIPAEKALFQNAIPDASMLVQNQGKNPITHEITYNAWKLQHRNPCSSRQFPKEPAFFSNKENMPSIIRKQVRFESPQSTNAILPAKPVASCARPLMMAPALINNPKPPFHKVLQDKPFEKIYTANIPHKNLDLSIIEPSKEPASAINAGFQNAEFLQSCKRPVAESTTIDKKSDEPSVKDLLKIIQQQNEQLCSLQKQVAALLEEKQVEKRAPPMPRFPEQIFKNKLEPKFAIDVMTSFEVSIRGPPNKFGRRFQNDEARITEISDGSFPSTTNKGTNDVSLALNESVQVRENCPSPENSIHVDMKDYSSDEEDNLDTNEIGWTIYNNVMDQVNCLMKKSQGQQTEKLAGTVMKQVKQATMKHLQNIGVNLERSEEESVSSECQYTPTQISFAVKQLLMKYLPDDQLAKLSNKPLDKGYPKNAISPRPDFSMASLEYMKKYNLLATNQGGKQFAPANKKQPSDKMLDITALKQQRKLL